MKRFTFGILRFLLTYPITTILVLVVWVFGILLPWVHSIYLPEPYYIELPKFKGRIVPVERVRINTPQIEDELEVVSTWGEDAILTYQVVFGNVVVNAWRPDEKTPGLFRHAGKKFAAPDDWWTYHWIKSAVLEGNRLKVSPWVEVGFFYFGALLLTIVIVVARAIFGDFSI